MEVGPMAQLPLGRGSWAPRFQTPNGICISSAIFAGLTAVTNIQTDKCTDRLMTPYYVCEYCDFEFQVMQQLIFSLAKWVHRKIVRNPGSRLNYGAKCFGDDASFYLFHFICNDDKRLSLEAYLSKYGKRSNLLEIRLCSESSADDSWS